ncbi:zinc finger and SCAN domain-containing protein 22 isoform 2-T4 [Dama dama]|uniref:zinc finger and SCAN domain-containing protein 22 isoform X2 n=1 Tax=Dama dama TaxID=30532 RepID=UPI002A36266C|nr:zinc finger and SCAN domain-containing protein 22 isoform X2 [Dama dama]XP_060996440.1 zinc finger and SCAN domain-containing protein 22 isoform X2 [Dama dama]
MRSSGWALGSELTDTSCKQSGSEESGPWDRATETVGGGTPPGPAFGDDCESKGGPERQARLSGEMWAQSAAHQMDLRKTSGPHKDAPPAQPSCEAGALGDIPHVRPDLTSREKTPSEERWDPPDGCGTEPPGTCSGRKPPMSREWGKTLRSPSMAHQKTRARKTPYTYSECGKAFCRSVHLAQHRVVHTGAKPHACTECGKAFGRLTHLSQHWRVHTGEKPYACAECGKTFRRSSHLSQHRWTHSGERPYACDACGEAFSQSTHLTQHRRVHTGEKPYECGAYGRAFSDCSALVQRVHSGEKPYQCRACPKAFTQSSSLLEHKRAHGLEALPVQRLREGLQPQLRPHGSPAPPRQRPAVTSAPPAKAQRWRGTQIPEEPGQLDWGLVSPRNDKVLTDRIWGCWGTALHSGTQREALRASQRSFQKTPAAFRSPLRAVSERLNPGGALVLEAWTDHVALLSGLRGPQVLGREADLHTPKWLPFPPAPLLCNRGACPRPPVPSHTLFPPPAQVRLQGQPGSCLLHEALSDPQPLWHLPCPEGALVAAQHPFLPARSVHGPPVVSLLILVTTSSTLSSPSLPSAGPHPLSPGFQQGGLLPEAFLPSLHTPHINTHTTYVYYTHHIHTHTPHTYITHTTTHIHTTYIYHTHHVHTPHTFTTQTTTHHIHTHTTYIYHTHTYITHTTYIYHTHHIYISHTPHTYTHHIYHTPHRYTHHIHLPHIHTTYIHSPPTHTTHKPHTTYALTSHMCTHSHTPHTQTTYIHIPLHIYHILTPHKLETYPTYIHTPHIHTHSTHAHCIQTHFPHTTYTTHKPTHTPRTHATYIHIPTYTHTVVSFSTRASSRLFPQPESDRVSAVVGSSPLHHLLQQSFLNGLQVC